MKSTFLALIVLIMCGQSAYADDEPDYMAKLRELAGGDDIDVNTPQALDYLSSTFAL